MYCRPEKITPITSENPAGPDMWPQVELPETWSAITGILKPAYEGPYPLVAVRANHAIPPTYREDLGDKTAIARAYLELLLPGVETSLLSDVGNTAIVLHDNNRAYKIFRAQPRIYSDIESEIATLTALHQEGIAPRPVALIDAGLKYRQDQVKPLHMFDGQQHIARVAGQGHLPVIVTELVETGPIDELPAELLAEQFDRFLEARIKHDLLLEDCEILYDRKNNKAIMIDVGAVRHRSHFYEEVDNNFVTELRLHFPDLQDQDIVRAVMVLDLLERFAPEDSRPHISTRKVIDLLYHRGTSAIHECLLQHRRAVSLESSEEV